MSLINKMLQDLEKRRHKPEGEGKTAAMGLSSVPVSKSHKLKPIILLGGIAVIVAVIGGLVVMSHNKADNIVIKQPSVIIPSIKELDVIAPVSEVQAVINKIILSQSAGVTTMNLIADQSPPQYQLSFEQNRLILTFSHTKFLGGTPEVPKFSAIETISTRDRHGDLQIVMKLVKNTHVNALGVTDDSPPTLSLLLNNKALAKASIEKVELPLTPQQQAEKDYQAALELAANGQSGAAAQKLQAILKAMPTYLPARIGLATLQLAQKNYVLANELIEAGLVQDPSDLSLAQLKARLLLSQDKNQEALTILLAQSPDIAKNPDYYVLLAAVYQSLKKPDQSVLYYEKLLTVQPHNSVWWLGLGLALEADSKKNQAAQAYRRAQQTGNLSPSLQVFVSNKLKSMNASQ